MTKNLETADLVAKLVMSGAIIVLDAVGILTGPFATLLVVLAVIVIMLTIIKLVVTRTRDQ